MLLVPIVRLGCGLDSIDVAVVDELNIVATSIFILAHLARTHLRRQDGLLEWRTLDGVAYLQTASQSHGTLLKVLQASCSHALTLLFDMIVLMTSLIPGQR